MKRYAVDNDNLVMLVSQIFWEAAHWKKYESRAVFWDRKEKNIVTCPYMGGECRQLEGNSRYKFINHYNCEARPEWIREDLVSELTPEIEAGIPSSWPVGMMKDEAGDSV